MTRRKKPGQTAAAPPSETKPGSRPADADARPNWARLHLWEIAALRDLAMVAGFALGVWMFVLLRSVTVPLALAFLLASLSSPVVDAAKRRFGWPRVFTTGLIVLVIVALAVAFVALGLPLFVAAAREFLGDLPQYAEALLGSFGVDAEAVREQLRDNGPPAIADAGPLFERLVGFVGFAASVLGSVIYALVAAIFTLIAFAWMTLRFDRMPNVQRFLPASRRVQIASILARFQRVFGGFVRGQVLVALFTTTGFAVGFSLLKVPHALVAAMIGGVLSFVPNGQASGWILAMLFSSLESETGGAATWVDIFVWPTCVYAVTQSLETFVVTPLVQGSYMRLHPLAVLGAILGGAAVGGLAGILLAIPVTACAWIVLRELVAPAMEQLAAER